MSIELVLDLFVQYGPWILFVAIVLDNAGAPIPGELLLLLFGALVRTGDLDPGTGLLVGTAAAMSGDSAGYWLGRLGGDRALRAYCRVTLGSGKCVANALTYYRRYGDATVVVGRFVIGVRAFLSPLAGASGMPFRRFLLFESSPFDLNLAALAGVWNHGSVVRSWLLELAQAALEKDPGLETIRGHVEDSGEGRWALAHALDAAVPAPVIALSLMARFRSRQSDSFANKLLAALRREFGGHATRER